MGVNAVMSRKMLQDVTCESAVCEASVEERGGQRGRGGRTRPRQKNPGDTGITAGVRALDMTPYLQWWIGGAAGMPLRSFWGSSGLAETETWTLSFR